jgi:hypothetical protein
MRPRTAWLRQASSRARARYLAATQWSSPQGKPRRLEALLFTLACVLSLFGGIADAQVPQTLKGAVNGPVNNNLFSSQGAGLLPNSTQQQQILDLNSLVYGDLRQTEIVAYTGYPIGPSTTTPFVQSYQPGATTADGYADYAFVNPAGNTAPLGQFFWFTTPSNVTAVNFTATIQLPACLGEGGVVRRYGPWPPSETMAPMPPPLLPFHSPSRRDAGS